MNIRSEYTANTLLSAGLVPMDVGTVTQGTAAPTAHPKALAEVAAWKAQKRAQRIATHVRWVSWVVLAVLSFAVVQNIL